MHFDVKGVEFAHFSDIDNMYIGIENMVNKRATQKYWFPLLGDHIKKEGIKRAEFDRMAYKVSPEPKARTWANAMKSEAGVSETTAYKIVKVLEVLELPSEVLKFNEVA